MANRFGLYGKLATMWLVGCGNATFAAGEGPKAAGEYGADLAALKGYYTPATSRAGNHYFDLWGGTKLREAVVSSGLTNNRTLIILSHGKGIMQDSRLRYAYYPDARVCGVKDTTYYSAEDFANIIGRENAAEIHNVVVAGCNMENAFDATEVRRYFVNATNVTHTPGGRSGFELVFRHTLLQPSSAIRLLYSTSDSNVGGINPAPAVRKVGFAPYLAMLYRPGAAAPYITTIAGRELIDPQTAADSGDQVNSLKKAALQIVAAARNARCPRPAGGPAELNPP